MSGGSSETQYDAVNVPDPDDKPRHEWSYVERRAEILERIERAGHPDALTKTDLAREYDVSHTTIGRDFGRLAEYVAGSLGERHTFIADRVFRGAIRNLVETGDHYRVAQVTEKWYSWLADVGAVAREQAGLNVDATVHQQQMETDDYVLVVEDD